MPYPADSPRERASAGPCSLRSSMSPRAGLMVRRMTVVTSPGRHVQVGHGHVLIEQIAYRGHRLCPLTDSSLVRQPGQLRLSMIGGLGGCLQPDLPANALPAPMFQANAPNDLMAR
jgi:hypothetical protein